MLKWLKPAIDYLPRWLEFQMRLHEQPGCVVALAYRDRIVLANGYASHGEPARLVRDRRGAVVEAWLGGTRYLREARAAKEMETRYGRRG